MEIEKLDWESCKEQFHESWWSKMQPIMESEEVYNIYQKLKEISSRKKKIVPLAKDTFNAFKYMDLDNLKSVWVLQDPYPNTYKNGTPMATGIAMSCDNAEKNSEIQPSLSKFYDGIGQCYNEEPVYDKSLKYLQEQGVMFLNSDLTCEARKTGSHERLWEPFMKMVFEEILQYRTGLIYVFAGKSSKRIAKFINPLGNYEFYTEHPAAAAHRYRDWEHDNIFKKINKYIIGANGSDSQIIWNKQLYNEIKELPF